MANLVLLARPCTRPGYETYHDLYLAWEYEGKKYCVRVRPQFGADNSKLLAHAVKVDVGESLDKYF